MVMMDRMIRLLFPPGEAFPRTASETSLGKLLFGISPAFTRLRLFFRGIVTESSPLTANDTLSNWQLVAGLPDPDFPTPSSTEELRATILSRLTSAASPTARELERIALSAGFVIRIEETTSFYFTVNTFEGLSDDKQARLTSIIERFKPLHLGTIYDYDDTVFRAGSLAGERLLEL